MRSLKTLVFFGLISGIALVSAASTAAADDDILRCTAEVVYNGNVYPITEGARDIEDAKREVVEEACDKACDALSGKDEKDCERACEAAAEIRSIDCVEKGGKHADKDKKHKKDGIARSHKSHQLCTADVLYQGKTYPVTEDVKGHEDAQKEILHEACDKVCDHLSDKDEKDCEHACKADATVQNLKCEDRQAN